MESDQLDLAALSPSLLPQLAMIAPKATRAGTKRLNAAPGLLGTAETHSGFPLLMWLLYLQTQITTGKVARVRRECRVNWS